MTATSQGDLPMVVGVGASAGGLQAFEAFLSGIPETERFAYVLVQHLSPDHKSELSRLLQPSTHAGVEQIEHGTPVERGRAYVIPPGKLLHLKDGAFQLSEPPTRQTAHSTVDTFLRSLASEMGTRAGCVILSGTGSDGALGLKSVKEAGGVCLVQDPEEAEYAGMPEAAIQTDQVDVIAPAAELGGRLAAYVDAEPGGDIQAEAGADGTGHDAEDDADRRTSEMLDRVFRVLQQEAGQDFSPYRLGTVQRRIHHRMRLRQIESLERYAEVLEREPEECRLLARDLLISVTSFFRDPEAFEDLKEAVIPRLFEEKGDQDVVRVWVPGCATGEEAYSLLMLLDEHRNTLPVSPRIQIFASDVDDAALDQGREGRYPRSITADVSEERLQRFFSVEDGGYRIRAKVRDQVIFAHHDLLQDPPFVDLDLISCRNLLIYFKREVQQRVIRLFHYALRDRGYLFLGRSETQQSARSLFNSLEGIRHCFRARIQEKEYTFPLVPIRPKQPKGERASRRSASPVAVLHRNEVAKRHLPPSVLVDSNFQICHLLGDVGEYLRIEQGLPSHSVLQLVPTKLRTELRAALASVFQGDVSRTLHYVRLATDDSQSLVDVIVEPVHFEKTDDDVYALVTFRPRSSQEDTDAEIPDADEAANKALRRERERADRLEVELESVRHRLQTVTEEYETSTEELLASNEELEAANEELRATTEELEVSREEIESNNEELLTLNRELEQKVERLNQMNSDLQNLMEATEIATLFLDKDLCLRQYTERTTDLFNVIPTDVGRPFDHVSHQLEDDAIADDAQRVLDRLAPVERELTSEDGDWYKMRIFPYRTVDDRIEGVVITLVDVTDLKEAEQRVEEMNAELEKRVERRTQELAQANEALQEEARQREKARDHFRRLFRLGPIAGVITTLSDGRIVDVNQRYLALTGYDREELLDEIVTEVGLVDPGERAARVQVLKEEGRIHSQEFRLHTREGDHVDMMFSSEIIERDGTPLVLSLGVNITARKKAEELMRKARDEAEAMNQLKTSFIANMSHEIRTPLTGIIGFADVLGEIINEEEPQRYIRYVRANGKRLLETLDSVLDLARLDAEEIQLQPAPVELTRFAEETVALFELRAEDKGLDLSVDVPEEPVRVELDTSLLQRVLNNLIDNAIKFTEDGSVRLELDVVKAEGDETRGESGQVVRLVVSDTGVGMGEAFQDRLFREFTQEQSGTDRPQEGAGLGLAITHRLVELMDGRIEIDSAEGAGTTATVSLPYKPVEDDGGETPDEGDEDVATDLRVGDRPPRILVVDDRPEVGLIVERFLSDCMIETAQTAPEGIEKASASAFDVILADIQLGAEGTGTDVLRAIRNLPSSNGRKVRVDVSTGETAAATGHDTVATDNRTSRDVPMLALTAHSLPGDRQRFLDEGFDAYLGKPFSRTDLRSALHRLLREAR